MLDIATLIQNGLPKILRHEMGTPENLFPSQKGKKNKTYTHHSGEIKGYTSIKIDGKEESKMIELRGKFATHELFYSAISQEIGNISKHISKNRANVFRRLDARTLINGSIDSDVPPATMTRSYVEDEADREISRLVTRMSNGNLRRKKRILAHLKNKFGYRAGRELADKRMALAYLRKRDRKPTAKPETKHEELTI